MLATLFAGVGLGACGGELEDPAAAQAAHDATRASWADPPPGRRASGANPSPPPPAPPAPPAAASTGTLVPLYTPPDHGSWAAVARAKRNHPTVPVTAVVNPANGPGSSLSASYSGGIAALADAGITVMGYVSTAYTQRAESDVQFDIDRWRSWYPRVTAIFFDEQSNRAGGESYYRRVSAYARSRGVTFTVGNPGVDTSPSYVGTVDVILIHESAGPASAAFLGGWHARYDRKNFGIVPYGVPQLDAAYVQSAKEAVGTIYITNDVLPNPWDSLPPYFDALLAALAA